MRVVFGGWYLVLVAMVQQRHVTERALLQELWEAVLEQRHGARPRLEE